MRVPTLGLISVLAAAACQPAPETPEQAAARLTRESVAAREAIAVTNTLFSQHVAAKQFDSVALLFAEDGRVMAPGMPAVVGREAIARQMARESDAADWTLTLSTDAVTANGPFAIERGTYTLGVTPGPSTPKDMVAAADTGKYLVHWTQVDGRWLMLEQIWNSDRDR